MVDDPLIDLQTLFPGIQKEAILKACRLLSSISAGVGDDHLRDILDSVWFFVNQLLRQDQSLNRFLASLSEFNDNVNNRGEDNFFSLLRDRAEDVETSGFVTRWAPLFRDDVFYNVQEDQVLYATESSLNAAVHAWNSDFRGGAADALLSIITNLLSPQTETYARATCIINSSGTGKSRMVDELSVKIITVPMCLRRRGSQGFPPPDVGLREYLAEVARLGKSEPVGRALHGVVYGILTVTHEQLNSFPCDVTLAEDLPDQEYLDLVVERQKQLAFAFREFMTGNQSFETVNGDREAFYGKVIKTAKRFNKRCNFAIESSITKSLPQYVDQDGKGVCTAGKTLCEFVDPRGVLDLKDWRWPLVLLSFDEPHVLIDGAKEGDWTLFSELRRILQRLDSSDNSIFTLFVSTAGDFRLLSPKIKSDPSSRVVNEHLLPFHPITGISFDCLAHPAKEDTVSLHRVVQIDWIAHLGRPLFGSYFDRLPVAENENDILRFAKQKLLNGKDSLAEADSSGSLACLATRFGLEFNEDEESREVTYKQVERHMRICVATTTGFTKMITYSASEPLLAEAAFQLLSNSSASPVNHLANHANLYCIDRGRRGELVAALIVMQARDASLPRRFYHRRWVFVTDFIQALLLPHESNLFLDSPPRRWRKGEQAITFRQRFADCRLWFNHVIKVEDSKVIRPEFLWKYIMRGAMIACKDNQEGVDLILPVSVSLDENISRHSVTAITIQVKNAVTYGFECKTKLFDAMDPHRLGILSDHPQPVIRMVFALASSEAGIIIPAPRERETRHPDNFTSYDIWCAGLDCFKQVGPDLDSYQKLLDCSQRFHDAFEVSEPYNPLCKETKVKVGKTRRSMVPLVKSSGHDEIHHPPDLE